VALAALDIVTVVRCMRGGLVESEHRVAWCVTGSSVSEAWPGAAELVTFARSAVKPFQALSSVRAGVLERFGFGERHLAVACASHGGSDAHVELVAEILASCGLDADALGCGPSVPRDPSVEVPPSRIRHNCSGKHALGLARCVHEGWPTAEYLDADHPLQNALRAEVPTATQSSPVGEAVDGCGMRTFALPLEGLARAFGRLAGGQLGPDADRVVAAMGSNPELVGYAGTIDTELMAGEDGVVAKVGAEGLLCIGLPDGRGVAIKALDGAHRPVPPAAVWLARAVLGLRADTHALAQLDVPPVLNSRGDVVGRLEVAAPPDLDPGAGVVGRSGAGR
jgi:L-asparaginase II